MRNYIMTTALFVSAIAVNGAFAEDTPVLKVDTTSQEKIEAANETSSAPADAETNSVKDVDDKTQTKAEPTTTETPKKSSETKNDAKSETKTKDDVAQKQQSDDIVTNSVETGNEAEKAEPQGVMDKILAYFSGE